MQSIEKMLERELNRRSLLIRPAFSTLMVLAVPLSPGVVLGVLTWVYWDGVLAGSIVFLGAMLIWLSVATTSIEINNGILSKRQFFHVRWSIETSNVSVRDGLAGDIPVIPAIIFSDLRTKKVIGSIMKPQFRSKDLQALREMLNLRSI